VTHLRKMMLEELQRRNYAETTTRHYIRTVEDFSRRFNCTPDRLGPRHIREYQAELFQKRKLSPGSVTQHLAALRFFYTKTLQKAWSIAETPYPKRAFHLPSILSQEEVTRLIARFAAANPARAIYRPGHQQPSTLPQVRWTHDVHRKTYCRRNPTSFSSHSRHGCRMNRLTSTRNLCVPQHTQSLCASPFYKPPLSILSTLFFPRVLRFPHLFIFQCGLSCSAAQPRRISTPHRPSIEFA
jgi:hypothetical protein